METSSKPHDWKEARRWRALELYQAGWSQREIAEALGVTEGAVSQWMSALDEGGPDALRSHARSGGPPKIPWEQLQLLPDCLSHGAEAYGFHGEVWNCLRVALVIEQEFGVRYHKAHVSRLLKRLNWTPQQPVRRASQRNDAQIEQWRTEVWPALKKRRPTSGACPSLWTNPGSICCRALSGLTRRAATRRCCGSRKPTTTSP